MKYFLLKDYYGEPMEMLGFPTDSNRYDIQKVIAELGQYSSLDDVVQELYLHYPNMEIVPWSNDDNLYL